MRSVCSLQHCPSAAAGAARGRGIKQPTSIPLGEEDRSNLGLKSNHLNGPKPSVAHRITYEVCRSSHDKRSCPEACHARGGLLVILEEEKTAFK